MESSVVLIERTYRYAFLNMWLKKKAILDSYFEISLTNLNSYWSVRYQVFRYTWDKSKHHNSPENAVVNTGTTVYGLMATQVMNAPLMLKVPTAIPYLLQEKSLMARHLTHLHLLVQGSLTMKQKVTPV